MALTNFARLTTEEKFVWARDTWKVARNNSFLTRFLGSDHMSMVQRITELKKTEKGARAVITLVADLEGDGVAGDRTLENNEEPIKSYDMAIRIDQLRHANRHEGRMAEQKSILNFREESRDVLGYWLADRADQLAFLTLSGVSYSYFNNGAARSGSDLPFLEFAADVSAPTSGRHLQWDKGTKSLVAADHASLLAEDTPTWEMLVYAKAYAKDKFIKPLRGQDGLEVYNVFMTPNAIAKLKMDPDFLAAWRNAMPRDSSNPLFKGTDVIYVDGLAIREFRHVFNTTGAASGSKWGASGTVDGQRTLICGAQALAYADIGAPEWVEKDYDYENQYGIAVGKIFGYKKPKFYSAITKQIEDFGVLCIDTAQ